VSSLTAGATLAPPLQQGELHDALVAAGIYLETGVPGLVGHGQVMVRLFRAVDDLVTRAAAVEGAEAMAFPPVLPRRLLELGGYVGSFPHLTGTVWAFQGDEAAARRQSSLVAAGDDWSGSQAMTDLALVPAACHPVYPVLAARGPLPTAGLTIDAGAANVFRHEPSGDPARLQCFHTREIVRLGAAAAVVAWRDTWRDRAGALLTCLGLDVRTERASDPFFGRAGQMLATSQREQALKFELLVPVTAPERTAVASFNAHGQHFSEVYGLVLDDGTPAHTACLGFGLERICVALLARHGLSPAQWPADVRAVLWPGSGR